MYIFLPDHGTRIYREKLRLRYDVTKSRIRRADIKCIFRSHNAINIERLLTKEKVGDWRTICKFFWISGCKYLLRNQT